MPTTRLLLAAALVAALPAAGAPDATPLTALPYTPGLDVAAMDRSADPCVDFYQYACGGWTKANPIPPDQSSWSVYGKLAQDNQRYLWGILEEMARRRDREPHQQKIGDLFASCMDEKAVDRLGAKPLAQLLARISGAKGRRELAVATAHLHMATHSDGFLFGFASNQDYGDSTRVIAFAFAGGLGLPDRDYYLEDNERMRGIREKYLAHVARMLVLLGDDPAQAAKNAATVMAIETALARASLTRTERRDPYKQFHKYDRKGLEKLAPGFDWDAYLAALGLGALDDFNVTQPKYFEELDRQLAARSPAEIRAWMRWHLGRAAAPYLSKAFVEENFDFYGRTLRGTPELRPRWKRCVAVVDSLLGEALGREFVARTFSPESKARALRMAKQIEQAMAERIRALDWMSPATKERALAKLGTVVNKIGYPERWRDYSALEVRRGDFFGNVARAKRFEARRDLAKIGKPLDRDEWYMTPPTVNAYYNPQVNDINFPAGVLQPPLFDPKMDDAPNYGNTGATIGHELTHGFDDEGRKYDAQGNLKDWWTPEDAKAFEERASCVADQYATYVIVDDIRINSRLTLGEDVADLGGLVLAHIAWKAETAGKSLAARDGLTPEQRFFVGYAQWACENERPENLRLKAVTDPHSPGRWRVNGLVVNVPEFAAAFSCKAGQPMVAERRCRVW